MAEYPRILIVDDDVAFSRLVARHLEQANFQIEYATSIDQAIAILENGGIDALVLDHVLPDGEGLTLLEARRDRGNLPPVIYLTASQDGRVAVAALKAGAADYVVKDVQGDFIIRLEAAVTNAIVAGALKRAKEAAEAEVRAARDEFKALAEERALLLREVNHRVSNSLQLIASLLHFQGEISSPEVKAALNEANGRVLAVARVHRSLYTSLDVRWINLGDYLGTLIDDLGDFVAGAGSRQSLSFKSNTINASPDVAVAVGIIATELILNSLKHAYPHGEGPVRIDLRGMPSEVHLIVEDDGIGVNSGSSDRQPGLGQRIIQGMAEKIDGRLRYEKVSKGTRAIFTFPTRDDIKVAGANAGEAMPATMN